MSWRERVVDKSILPYIILCTNLKQYNEALDDLNIDPERRPSYCNPGTSDATMHTFDAPDGGIACVVCLKDTWKDNDGIQTACLLAHEAVHIFQKYLTQLGGYEFNSELEAYYVQHILQELMNAFVERSVE